MDGYNISKQLPEGEKQEAYIDEFFKKKWNVEIQYVSRADQRNGMDRIWTWQSGARLSVEYKADTRADETNNVFIETVSVDTANKPGWAYTSLAQYLLYYIPPRKISYFLPMTKIKQAVQRWRKEYRNIPIPNKDKSGNHSYNTWGVAVPIEVFVNECEPSIVAFDVEEVTVSGVPHG